MTQAVRLLLEWGADVDLAASSGTTPMMEAAGRGYPEVLRLLLDRGVALDAQHPGDGATSPGRHCHSTLSLTVIP